MLALRWIKVGQCILTFGLFVQALCLLAMTAFAACSSNLRGGVSPIGVFGVSAHGLGLLVPSQCFFHALLETVVQLGAGSFAGVSACQAVAAVPYGTAPTETPRAQKPPPALPVGRGTGRCSVSRPVCVALRLLTARGVWCFAVRVFAPRGAGRVFRILRGIPDPLRRVPRNCLLAPCAPSVRLPPGRGRRAA